MGVRAWGGCGQGFSALYGQVARQVKLCRHGALLWDFKGETLAASSPLVVVQAFFPLVCARFVRE